MEANNNDLQSRMERLSNFISFFSHEIRAPLGGINGLSELLLMEFDQKTEEQKEWIESIRKYNFQALDAYADFLDASAIIQNTPQLYLEQVDLLTLLKNTERSINQGYWLARAYRVEFLIESTREVWQIEADYNNLFKMLQWFFARQCSPAEDYKNTTHFLIVLKSIQDQVVIVVSNVSEGKESKIHELNENDIWAYLIFELLRVHSGNLAFKPDKNGKTFAEIILPVKQKQIETNQV